MPDVVSERLENYFQELWEKMQDDYSLNLIKFEGVMEFALHLKLISKEKFELWSLRIKNCPDPKHLDGRLWCAYCGDVNCPAQNTLM